jgi:hypothetical protein
MPEMLPPMLAQRIVADKLASTQMIPAILMAERMALLDMISLLFTVGRGPYWMVIGTFTLV